VGIDKVITGIIENIGKPELIILTGDYAKGIDSGIIDIIIVGNVDKSKLENYVVHAEDLIERKVRYLILTRIDLRNWKKNLKKMG
jgi:hypothetical protein